MPITILLPALVTVIALGSIQPSRQVDTSPRAVLRLAGAQLQAYKPALAFVLADEHAVQQVTDGDDRRVARRETTGEFFLTFVKAEGGWLAVRDIATVDGVPVPNREELSALLRQGSIARIGRAVYDRNARYNIGSVTRNFNDPMFALIILEPEQQGRFRFSRTRVETSADLTLVTLEFTERDRPTIVRGADGRPVYARGTLVIDAVTGRLHRSEVTVRNGPTTARLTTTFAHNDRLDLWLPDVMEERYDHRTSDRQETVTVQSRYTNYRRFETLARIK